MLVFLSICIISLGVIILRIIAEKKSVAEQLNNCADDIAFSQIDRLMNNK